MDVEKAVCLVLAGVLTFAFSEAVEAQDACETLGHCVADIDKYILSSQMISKRAHILNETNLDEFCQKTEAATKCISEHKDECKSSFVVENVEFYETQAVYTCTEDGRKEALAISKCKCYTNVRLRLKLRKQIDKCNSQVMAGESDDACETENQRAECIVDVGKRKNCDPDFVKYLIRIETKVAREKLGCPPFNCGKC